MSCLNSLYLEFIYLKVKLFRGIFAIAYMLCKHRILLAYIFETKKYVFTKSKYTLRYHHFSVTVYYVSNVCAYCLRVCSVFVRDRMRHSNVNMFLWNNFSIFMYNYKQKILLHSDCFTPTILFYQDVILNILLHSHFVLLYFWT